ncbi:MAG: radical SAM protein [Schwartzia sp.]|nr:radical SAM protein [Schwartzia sp. (in: firmicutes)]
MSLEMLSMDALANCTLCPRRCGVNRLNGELGYCGAGRLARSSLVSLHPREEPCIAGKNGAGTVFFSHCSLRCLFCQNSLISHEENGIDVTEERLAEIFLEQQERGAATLDLVTPTHFAPQILAALRMAKSRGLTLPVVWNSSGYERAEIIRAAADEIDVFLPDLKYIDEKSASECSDAREYFSYASAAIEAMVEAKGAPVLREDGILASGVLVRHLILPGRRKESMKILDWLWATFGDTIMLSLMGQYTPMYRAAEIKGMNRKLTTFEYESVVGHALDLGITRCYVQERGAASEEFVPKFDGTGVIR